MRDGPRPQAEADYWIISAHLTSMVGYVASRPLRRSDTRGGFSATRGGDGRTMAMWVYPRRRPDRSFG